jgi:hypothetical protein
MGSVLLTEWEEYATDSVRGHEVSLAGVENRANTTTAPLIRESPPSTTPRSPAAPPAPTIGAGDNAMNPIARKVLYWSPRILTILFACFVSIFALDVFGQGSGFWGTALALAMHLIPTALLLGFLLLAWRWEWIGALAFLALALVHAFLQRNHAEWLRWISPISGPLIVLSVLWLLNWRKHAELRGRS